MGYESNVPLVSREPMKEIGKVKSLPVKEWEKERMLWENAVETLNPEVIAAAGSPRF